MRDKSKHQLPRVCTCAHMHERAVPASATPHHMRTSRSSSSNSACSSADNWLRGAVTNIAMHEWMTLNVHSHAIPAHARTRRVREGRVRKGAQIERMRRARCALTLECAVPTYPECSRNRRANGPVFRAPDPQHDVSSAVKSFALLASAHMAACKLFTRHLTMRLLRVLWRHGVHAELFCQVLHGLRPPALAFLSREHGHAALRVCASATRCTAAAEKGRKLFKALNSGGGAENVGGRSGRERASEGAFSIMLIWKRCA